jgi:hypothetical protein
LRPDHKYVVDSFQKCGDRNAPWTPTTIEFKDRPVGQGPKNIRVCGNVSADIQATNGGYRTLRRDAFPGQAFDTSPINTLESGNFAINTKSKKGAELCFERVMPLYGEIEDRTPGPIRYLWIDGKDTKTKQQITLGCVRFDFGVDDRTRWGGNNNNGQPVVIGIPK